jgi:hypothetical protein
MKYLTMEKFCREAKRGNFYEITEGNDKYKIIKFLEFNEECNWVNSLSCRGCKGKVIYLDSDNDNTVRLRCFGVDNKGTLSVSLKLYDDFWIEDKDWFI